MKKLLLLLLSFTLVACQQAADDAGDGENVMGDDGLVELDDEAIMEDMHMDEEDEAAEDESEEEDEDEMSEEPAGDDEEVAEEAPGAPDGSDVLE